MIIFKTNQLICYDVDETLIMWNKGILSTIPIKDPFIIGVTNHVLPNEKHIELLKKHKARGFTVIVWSAQGVEWAEAVVKALELEEYVDAVFSKPSGYVDDLPVDEWIGPRIYIK
jgi:hydroxymethylpyrimidine pyrophosphatase-like HAD family hydrolase